MTLSAPEAGAQMPATGGAYPVSSAPSTYNIYSTATAGMATSSTYQAATIALTDEADFEPDPFVSESRSQVPISDEGAEVYLNIFTSGLSEDETITALHSAQTSGFFAYGELDSIEDAVSYSAWSEDGSSVGGSGGGGGEYRAYGTEAAEIVDAVANGQVKVWLKELAEYCNMRNLTAEACWGLVAGGAKQGAKIAQCLMNPTCRG